MKQATLQELYNLISEGKGDKNIFHKQAIRQFPNLFTAQSGFDQVVTVLKQKQIISETTTQATKQTNWFDVFKTNMNVIAEEVKAEEKKTAKEVEDTQSHNYDYKNKKSIDNHSGAEFLEGFYLESRDPKNSEKTVEQIKDIVIKNLAKDQLYYVKDGAFGVKGLGYKDEAPGLGKTKEVTGKYKSSGMEPVKLSESKHSDEADLKIYKSELNMLNKTKPTGEKQLKRKAELEKKIADLEKSTNESLDEAKLTIPELNQLKIGEKVKYLGKDKNGFKNGEEYEVSRRESSSTFQPTITIKNDKGQKLRTSNLSKVNESLDEVDAFDMPTGAMMIQMADNNPKQFRRYIRMMKDDPGFKAVFMKKLSDSEKKEFADKLKTLKEGLPKGYWAKNIPGGKDEMNEDYKALVKKIKGQGKSEKSAKAIAGAVASAKLKGAGKGPTSKQKARSK